MTPGGLMTHMKTDEKIDFLIRLANLEPDKMKDGAWMDLREDITTFIDGIAKPIDTEYLRDKKTWPPSRTTWKRSGKHSKLAGEDAQVPSGLSLEEVQRFVKQLCDSCFPSPGRRVRWAQTLTLDFMP